MTRRAALLAVAVLAVAAGLGALGYAVARDPTLPASLTSKPPPDWSQIAQRFHKGPGPCLRYWKTPAADAEVKAVVERMASAGVTCEGLKSGSLELIRRGFELDLGSHAASEGDELAEVAREDLPWWGDAVLRRKGVDLRRMFAVDPARFAKAAEGWAAVPPPQRQALDEAWRARPTAFVLSNLIPVLTAMNVRATRDRLDALAHLVEAARDAGRTVAEAQREIEGLPSAERLDCWGMPIEVTPTKGGVQLASRGEDQKAGGEGSDADLTRVVAWKDEPEVAAGTSGCGPLPATVTFERAEVDRFSGDMGDLASQARVVPFFENGQVVGFKIFRIAPGSLYARLRLCEGDVVNVTGVPPTAPAQALDAYLRFHAGKPVELRVRRGAVESTLVAQIR